MTDAELLKWVLGIISASIAAWLGMHIKRQFDGRYVTDAAIAEQRKDYHEHLIECAKMNTTLLDRTEDLLRLVGETRADVAGLRRAIEDDVSKLRRDDSDIRERIARVESWKPKTRP